MYHHTDTESAKKIIESGHIIPSDPKYGDAIAGKGTYVNSLGPSVSKSVVLKNNYDGMIPIDQRKADVVFELQVPKERVQAVKTSRNVLKVIGSIKLDSNTRIHDRTTGKTYKPPK